jgi:hypothetical protein
LVCVVVGTLIAACDSGGGHFPGGPGSGGARAGAGGGPTPATGGAGGNLSTGTGGNISTGAGGLISTGAGGSLATGAGGLISTGAGGLVSTGTGGLASTGAGGLASTGTGGSLATGAGGSHAGAGGGGAAAGGASGGTAGGGGDSAGGRGGASSARCGNGVRDMELFERCDGEDLAGETCQSIRGFASGTLRCSPSQCVFDTSGCSPCTKDPVVLGCGVKPPDLSPYTVAMGANGAEVALAWATSNDASAGKMRFSRLNAAFGTISTVRVNEPGIAAAGYWSNTFSVAPLPSGWVIAGMGLSNNLFVHTFDAAGANVGRITMKAPEGNLTRVVVVPRPNGGPLLVFETNGSSDFVTHLYAAVVSADGASTTAPVEVPFSGDFVSEIGRGSFADGLFYVPFTTVMQTDTVMRPGHLAIARVSTTGTLADVADPLPSADVHSPALVTAEGQLALSYKGSVDGAPPGDPYAPQTFFSVRLALSGAVASSPPLVLADRAMPGPLLAVGDAVLQVLDESNVPVGPGYLGESLELVQVPATGPLGEKHQLLAAGYLPPWHWLDAVTIGSDVVIAWLDSSEGPLQLIRVRP